MSQYDADVYEKFASQVRKQVQSLRLIINGLQAKAKDRQWLKNQTMGIQFIFKYYNLFTYFWSLGYYWNSNLISILMYFDKKKHLIEIK